jgi:uncharacterized membrane protein
LIAGVFLGFTVSINPAFKHLTDDHYIVAMKKINRVIENPIFLLTFIGPVAFLPIAVFLHVDQKTSSLLTVSFVIYLVAVFGITSIKNVPLNRKLDRFVDTSATTQEKSVIRKNYASKWNFWHLIRTIGSIIAFCISVLACITA